MAFDYAQFMKIFNVAGGSYRFANTDILDNRDTYRSGLQDAAKGQISAFDANNDNSWNFDEFATKEADTVARMIYDEQEIDVDSLDEAGKKDFNTLVQTLKAQTKEENKTSFSTLDLNSDGKIDYKEVAAEIVTADVNDGNQDGVVSAKGYHAIYNDKNSPNVVKQAFKDNYVIMRLNNLGEAGDINEENVAKSTSPATSSTATNPTGSAIPTGDTQNSTANNNDKMQKLKQMFPMLMMIMMMFAMLMMFGNKGLSNRT